ncbi:MAG: zinc ribbon domain-containing protein [Candidatus Hodarchaeota archaeon]
MRSKFRTTIVLAAIPLMILSLLHLPFSSEAPQQFVVGTYITESFTITASSAQVTGWYNFTITGVSPPNITFAVVSYEKANGQENTETGTVTINANTRIILSSTLSDFYMEVGDYCDLWIPTNVDLGSIVQVYDDTLVVHSSAFFNGYECWDLIMANGLSGFDQHMYFEKETGIYLGVVAQGNVPIIGYVKAHYVVTSTNIDALSDITGRIEEFPWLIVIVAVIAVIIVVSIALLWRRKRRVPQPAEEAPETPEEAPTPPPPANFCPYCGTENLLEALFCANCGSNLERKY